jgi:Exoribonuclease R
VIVDKLPNDILVRPNDFNTALHGDTVVVRIKDGNRQSGRLQGVVQEVVQRKQTEFMGRIEIGRSSAFFIADVDKPMPDIVIPMENLNGAKEYDSVIVRITEWERGKKPIGEVVTIMDKSNVNDMAMKEILMENGFPLFFPKMYWKKPSAYPISFQKKRSAAAKTVATYSPSPSTP